VHKGASVTPRAIPNARIAEQYVQPDSDLPRVMLFHDSYAMLVKPMLAVDCSRLVCIWQTTLDLARIEEEHPDVVIDMMVERMLGRPIPADSPLDSQAELQAAFEVSGEVLFDREALLSEGEIEAVGESVFRRVLHAPERGIGITPGTGFGLFNCPELRIPEGSDAVVALELTAPEDTTIEFLYPRGPVLDYPRAFAVRVFVHAGRSRVYARIRPRDFTIEGRLRVGSGTRAGEWILHRVEARAIPEVHGD